MTSRSFDGLIAAFALDRSYAVKDAKGLSLSF